MKQIKKSFTLVELMIVIAILAILSAIVIFVLNPGRLFDNMRDIRRVTDITSIHKAINFMETWNTSMTYGTSTFVYISIPATNANCSDIAGLPTLPAGYTYACSSQANYKKTDGTGWIPINFTVSSDNRYLSNLPVDPVNDNTYFYTYFPGGSYELTALLKNPNTNSINSEGSMTGAFTIGSPNRTKETPLSRDTNLIARWTFDEDSGNALDYSGNNYIGTLNGPERVVTTGANKAMHYDAAGLDYIVTPSFAISDTGILTIEIWMKSVLNATTSQFIIGDNLLSSISGSIYMYRSQNNDIVYFRYADGSTGRYPGFTFFTGYDNQWVNIAIICDYANKTIKAYRNGIEFESTQNLVGNPLFPSSNNVKYIGSHNIISHKLVNGFLDDVRIYNRGLSADEISQIYNATKSRYE